MRQISDTVVTHCCGCVCVSYCGSPDNQCRFIFENMVSALHHLHSHGYGEHMQQAAGSRQPSRPRHCMIACKLMMCRLSAAALQ
jgi:hypothetical protein